MYFVLPYDPRPSQHEKHEEKRIAHIRPLIDTNQLFLPSKNPELMRRATIFLFLLYIYITPHAQKPLYTHQQWFKVEDGLPQSFISDVVQDADGFIWLSTFDGIARYDGRAFRIFRQSWNDSSTMSSNVVIQLSIDIDNRLWLFYQGRQVECFDPRTLRMIPINTDSLSRIMKPHASTIIEPGGKFWTFLQYAGIKWVEPLTQKTHEASVANGLLKEDTVLATAHEKNGRMWLLSRNSIQVSDTNRSEFRPIPLATPLSSDFDDWHIAMDIKDGQLTALTRRYIWTIDVNTGHLKKIPSNIGDDFISGGGQLHRGGDGRLYYRGITGIHLIQPTGTTLLWQNTLPPYRRTTSMLVDRSGVLWVGIDASGLVKVNLRNMPLYPFAYRYNFHFDVLEKLGIDTTKMPERWRRGTSYNFRYTYGPDSTLYLARNAQDSNVLELFGYRNGQLFGLPMDVGVRRGIRGIAADKHGGVWALDNNGHRIWYWQNIRSKPVSFYAPEIKGRDDNLADMVMVDDYQWITTYGNGLYKIQRGKILEHADRNSKNGNIPFDLTDICVDPVHPTRLWIGSMGGGLVLWDVDKGLQRIFTTADGLPNNTVYCIVADRSGKLWLSTNKGICRFDPGTYDVHSFEKLDGLPGNEFNRSHQFSFPDGRIAFGGVDGYVIFQPADFREREDSLPLSIQITDIAVNNQPLSEEIMRGQSLSSLTGFSLPYNKNSISISFAALQFNEPQKIKYRYRLKGVSSDWVEAGYNNTAHYTQLSPGDYQLEINATNLGGRWSSAVRTLRIRVLPPLWRTWWAYCIYGLLAVGCIAWYLRYRDKRTKEQQQLIFEQKEAERLRELDEVKTRFFSNITHEFRTPLTLITVPLERISRDPSLPTPMIDTIQTVQRNAHRLLGLINQLLDLSKIEAGQLKLQYSHGDFKLFAEDMVKSFAMQAAEKQINFSYAFHEIKGIYRFDEEKWERIISNLLGNAIKFTPAGGSITVSFREPDDHSIQLKVQDSGPGIGAEHLQKVFDRFYQVDTSGTRSYEGSGIGLSLVKELTKLMKGTVTVQSKPGEGALFTVTVPVERMENGTIADAVITEQVSITNGIAHHGDREKPLLLVAEDNDELRRFIVQNLAQHWQVMEAPDGVKAWDMILAEMPDLVISDVMMPRRDGFELCDMSKKDPRTAHIGFLLLTAKSTHASKIEGLGSGADGYVTKPFHWDELELRIHNLLQLQEKTRAFLQSQLLPPQPEKAPEPVEHPFLQELYKVLDRRLDDPQLGVESLAAEVGMSRSSLNRKLKNLLDISASDLIRRYRLQKAAAMLAEGMDISGAAYRSGFSTPSYFTQCFKDQYGITPSAFLAQQGLTQN